MSFAPGQEIARDFRAISQFNCAFSVNLAVGGRLT
jgi:hypothetical protein